MRGFAPGSEPSGGISAGLPSPQPSPGGRGGPYQDLQDSREEPHRHPPHDDHPRRLVLRDRLGVGVCRGVGAGSRTCLVAMSGMLAGPLLLSRFMAVYSLRGLQVRRKAPQGVSPATSWWAASRLPTPAAAWEVGRCWSRRRISRRVAAGFASVLTEHWQSQCRPAAATQGKKPPHDRLLPLSPRGTHAASRLPRPPRPAGTLPARSVAHFDAVPLRVVLPHVDVGGERIAAGVSAAGAADPRLGAASPRGVRRDRTAASSAPAPTATSTASAPGGAATAAAGFIGGRRRGRGNSSCGSSSSRGTATWRCCSTSGSPTAPKRRTARTSNWRSVSPRRSSPIFAARGTATSI